MSKLDLDTVNAILLCPSYDEVPESLRDIYTVDEYCLIHFLHHEALTKFNNLNITIDNLKKKVNIFESMSYKKQIIREHNGHRQFLNKGKKTECDKCGDQISVEGKKKHQKTDKCKKAYLQKMMENMSL
jgi:hypothetical protein